MLEKLSSKSTYIFRNHPIMIPARKVNNWYPCNDGSHPRNYRDPIFDDFIDERREEIEKLKEAGIPTGGNIKVNPSSPQNEPDPNLTDEEMG